MEKEFNYKDSLRVIDEMIAQAKHKSHPAEGFVTLFWGFLTMAAALLQWYMDVVMKLPYAPAAWFLMLIGAVVTIVLSKKVEKQKPVKTYVDILVGQVWLAFMVSFAVLFFALGPDQGRFLPTVILLYGSAQWVHGSLLKFKPYKAGAVAFWLASAAAFQVPQQQQLLILAAVVVLGFIVPGYLLRTKSLTSHV